jgi:hypothetical protein
MTLFPSCLNRVQAFFWVSRGWGPFFQKAGAPMVRTFAVAAFFVAVVSTNAFGQCQGHWDVSDPLRFSQSNGYVGTFNLTLNGTTLSGNASESVGAIVLTNPLEGSLVGDKFTVTVYWATGAVGEYRGTISPAGWIVGETHDVMHPNNKAQWRSERQLGCVVAATAPTKPPRTYIKSLGRAPRPQVASTCRAVPAPGGGLSVGGSGRSVNPQQFLMPATDMTGTWRVAANGGAWHYDFSLIQRDTGGVEGSYKVLETGVTGTILGTLEGRALKLTWTDSGTVSYAGTGNLQLGVDCNSFEGSYSVTYIPPGYVVAETQGAWRGERQ